MHNKNMDAAINIFYLLFVDVFKRFFVVPRGPFAMFNRRRPVFLASAGRKIAALQQITPQARRIGAPAIR
jgi:hypothetical protein